MATTIKQTEAIPASYPDDGTAAVWQRLESYIAHRFTEREVVWTVAGPGEWAPPLVPATVAATEIWQDDTWTSVTLTAGPLGGYVLDGEGPYRFTADVGGGTVPAAVAEAYTRLSGYLTAIEGSGMAAGVATQSVSIGPIREHTERDPNAWAKAIQYSGAADLLRPYRRA